MYVDLLLWNALDTNNFSFLFSLILYLILFSFFSYFLLNDEEAHNTAVT